MVFLICIHFFFNLFHIHAYKVSIAVNLVKNLNTASRICTYQGQIEMVNTLLCASPSITCQMRTKLLVRC